MTVLPRAGKEEYSMTAIVNKYNFENLEFLMFVLDEFADALAAEGRDVIKLTLGKAQEPLHQDIIEAHVDAVRNPEKRNLVYPEGLPILREKIAEWYTSWGNPVSKKNVLINTGTSPFFKDLFHFLLEEGDELLMPLPYYSVYYVSGLLTPAKINSYAINPKTFKIDMEDLKAKYHPEKTKILVLCSPGNPYGNLITREEYEEILSFVSDETYIVSDEIYRNTGFYEEVPSILDVVKKRDNIIVTNSFSKGFRMYTARVGFSILPEKLLEPMRVLLQHTLLTTNPTEQFAAVEALNHLDEVKDLTRIYRTRNEYTAKTLGGVKDIQVLKADGGFYLVVLCGDFMEKHNISSSFDLAKDILESTGVAVVPGSDFGLPEGLRISFTHLRFNEGIDRLFAYFTDK